MTTASSSYFFNVCCANQVIIISGGEKKTKQPNCYQKSISRTGVFKVGETYSISHYQVKRIPLVVEGKHSSPLLDRLAKDPTMIKGR